MVPDFLTPFSFSRRHALSPTARSLRLRRKVRPDASWDLDLIALVRHPEQHLTAHDVADDQRARPREPWGRLTPVLRAHDRRPLGFALNGSPHFLRDVEPAHANQVVARRGRAGQLRG